MNKKLIVTTLLTVLAALAVAGVAAAQTPTPPTPTGGGYGYGMMGGGYGMMGQAYGGGMMGGAFGKSWMRGYANGEYGPMHDAMFDALAEKLGLTRAELDQRVAEGETPYTIALSLGYTQAEFAALMTEVRSAALAAAVAEGLISQQQADWMMARMARMNGQCPHLTSAP